MKRVVSNALFFMMLLNGIVSVPLFAEENGIPSEEKVSLTEEEQTWLKAHPDIQLGYTDTFEPEVIVNPDGTYRGILVDFLDELNRRLGAGIRLRIDPVPELAEKARKKGVDGILSIHPDYADKLGLSKTKGYITGYPTVFASRNVSFVRPSDLASKKVAIIDKVFFSEQIVKQYGEGATVLKVKSALQGLQSVDRGEADLFVGASINSYLLTKYQLFGLVPQYVFYNSPVNCGMAIRSDWPELVAIVNKGLSSFSKEEIEAILAKWSHLPEKQQASVKLTPEERDWLAKDHTVRVRVVDFPPFMILGKGKPTGISIVYLKLISERTDIRFEFVEETRPFADAFESLKDLKGPDLMQCIAHTVEKKPDTSFTKAYLSSPRVIFTRDDEGFVSSIDDLADKTISVPRGTAVSDILTTRYPHLHLLLFDTDKRALAAVASGEADAYIGNLTLASFLIHECGFANMKVAAPSPLGDHVFSFGIRKDWSQLSGIMNKALDTIPPKERSTIRGKYLSMKYEYGIRPRNVVKWILIVSGAAALIVLGLDIWNRALNRMVREHTSTLAESEERFRGTFEQAAVGIAHVSPEGRFLRINQRFCDIVEYTHAEMLARTFQDITHPDDLNADVEQIERLLHGDADTYSMEKRYFRKDGEIVWVNLTVSLLRDAAGKPILFVSVIEDITRRKELQQERDRILDLSHDLICIAGMDGYFKYLNPAWETILGYTREDLLARPFLDFIHPDDHAKNDEEVESLAAGRDTIHLENRYVHKNGTIRHISWVATPLPDEKRIYWIGRDITERKQAEQDLEDMRNYTDHLIQTANVMIVSLDAEGRVTHFNPAAEAITGYTFSEIRERDWFGTLVPPDRCPEVNEEFKRLMQGGLPRFFENPIVTKDGRERFISWSNSEIRRGKEIVGVTSFGIDITERKKAEEALRDSEEQFRQLVEQSPISIQLMSPDGRITKVNRALMALWGFTEDSLPELLAKYNILEDEQARELGMMPLIEKAFSGEAVILPVIECEGSSTMETISLPDVKGNKVWIQVRLYPVKNRRGEVVSVVQMEEDITERKHAEEEVQQYQERLKALASQLTVIEERERRRIAADLHDHVGQSLAFARIQLAAARKSTSLEKRNAILDDTSETMLHAIQDTKNLIFELSAPSMNEIGLGAAISEWLEEHIGPRYGLKTEFIDKIDDSLRKTLDDNVRAILFRNVRELLTNVVKHAHANQVSVSMGQAEGSIKIVVHDDGVGFNAREISQTGGIKGGFGLFGIEERMTNLGGSMEIVSEPGKGCKVVLRVPLSI